MATAKNPTKSVGSDKAAHRTRMSQSDVPAVSLDQALRVPTAIAENYGGGPVTALQLADAMMMQPTSGTFRQLCGAAIAFGFTQGGYNAQEITLEPLGKRVIRPEEDGDDLRAKREAILRPRVLSDFLRKYNRSPLPPENIGRNVLMAMGVPADRTDGVFRLIHESAKTVGFIREIKGREYVDLLGTSPATPQIQTNGYSGEHDEAHQGSEASSLSTAEQPSQESSREVGHQQSLGQAIFVGHGKNKIPLEQLKGILDGFKIPYRIATESPNLGRPISDKVAQIMRECNCAILVFTADEEFQDKDGNTIWRPSENVVHELGAASFLYGKRIVILKEESVNLPSNFRDIGYIEFSRDALAARSMDVLKELIGFGIVKVTT
jgi:predicted nucleotide-binding protein